MEIKLTRQQKIQLTAGRNGQAVEIDSTAIEAGVLKMLPEPCLSVFLYLATHLNQQGYLETNPTIIAGYVPYSTPEVVEALENLEEKSIIEQEENRQADKTFPIYLHPEALKPDQDKQQLPDKDIDNRKYRQQIVRQQSVNREELEYALLSFMHDENQRNQLKQSIDSWLEDFENKMIQELIRRVDKWLSSNNHQQDKAIYYLQGIIDDWYRKDIFSYQRLQHFDRLFRETRELAQSYGFKQWQNLNPVQMETFKNWLEGEQALSLEVAQLAIKEAIQRKKDGQPSLKYIEDNFIKPWQEAGIRNVREAREYLAEKDKKTPPDKSEDKDNADSKSETTPEEQWENFTWDFDFSG